jgi:hypothetical protein
MFFNQSQNLDKNETRKAGFLPMLRTKEPPKVLLCLQIVIEHINHASAYHKPLIISYIDTNLPHLQHNHIPDTRCSRFLYELVDHPNNLFDDREEQMVIRLANQLRNGAAEALVVVPDQRA